MRSLRAIGETIGGILELCRLAVISRFRLGGPYWRWRRETAFGSRPAEHLTRRQRLAAILEYGRWVHRMKRTSRRRPGVAPRGPR